MGTSIVNSIRETFSRGSVSFSDNVIMVSFGNGVSQSIAGSQQVMFESMLSECELFKIVMSPKDGFRMVFEYSKPTADDAVYYRPVGSRPAVVIDQSRRVFANNGLTEAFDGVDLSDEAAVKAAFARFMEAMELADDDGVFSIKKTKQWGSVQRAAYQFREYAGFLDEFELLPPDSHSNGVGSIAFIYSANKRRVLRFKDEAKAALLQMIRYSDGIDFDCWIDGDAVFEMVVGTERDQDLYT